MPNPELDEGHLEGGMTSEERTNARPTGVRAANGEDLEFFPAHVDRSQNVLVSTKNGTQIRKRGRSN